MKLVIIGVGKMGGAVLEGALQAGLLEPHEVGIIEPFLARAQDIQAQKSRTTPHRSASA